MTARAVNKFSAFWVRHFPPIGIEYQTLYLDLRLIDRPDPQGVNILRHLKRGSSPSPPKYEYSALFGNWLVGASDSNNYGHTAPEPVRSIAIPSPRRFKVFTSYTYRPVLSHRLRTSLCVIRSEQGVAFNCVLPNRIPVSVYQPKIDISMIPIKDSAYTLTSLGSAQGMR